MSNKNKKTPPISEEKLKEVAEANVVTELQTLYNEKLLPIEKRFLFHKFHAPEILPSELTAKPQVLLLGQYSVRHRNISMNY